MNGRQRRRVRCPMCGRLACERRYADGDRAYIHTTKEGHFGAIEVVDSCYVKAVAAVAKVRGEEDEK